MTVKHEGESAKVSVYVLECNRQSLCGPDVIGALRILQKIKFAEAEDLVLELKGDHYSGRLTFESRVTVMLSCTADGRKLPPYVVFKRKTLPKGEKFPKNVVIRCQDKGWMDESLVLDWIKSVWCRRPGALLGFPSMLVLDAFRCHLADSVKRLLRDSRTELVVIPGGMTSQLQPLDVCINKPFKDHIRRLYMEWMRSGEPEVTPAGRLKRTSPAMLCAWIAEAWACIPEALVCRAFKKCSISNALDGTEDEVLWEDISDKGTSEESASDEDDE